MKRKQLIMMAILATTVTVACGSPEEKPASSGETTGPVDDANSRPANASTTENMETEEPDPEPPTQVSVECVSQLVTHGGNYYALKADIVDGAASVEMVHYLAATPTSDPEEEAIWTGEVAAEFTAQRFAFTAPEHFLTVSKAPQDPYYEGTMSGQTEFGSDVQVWCWPVGLAHPASYDASSGTCVDASGAPTRNVIPWMVALRTGFGQCATYVGELTGEAFGYPTFDFIDLRGADFNGAALHFANLQDVQLEGADLRQFDYGYAVVAGTIDAHTQLPELGDCAVDETESTLSCTR